MYNKVSLRNEPAKGHFVITNFWTYAIHGHARSELRQISKFLESRNLMSHVVSVTDDFGESPKKSKGNILHRRKIDHIRYLKNFVDRKLILDLRENIENLIANKHLQQATVVISSARTSHIHEIAKSWTLTNEIKLRLIEAPNGPKEWEHLARSLKKFGNLSCVGLELKKSVLEARNFFDNVIHVPPAQSLNIESEHINSQRGRVGIFWPVGRPFSLNKVDLILKQLRSYRPIVKLPPSLNTNSYCSNFPEIEFIQNGISDIEFEQVLKAIKVAVLAHENYLNQSSAYASYFASNNVHILTSESNEFRNEFNLRSFNLLDSEFRDLEEKVRTLLAKNYISGKAKHATYSEQEWEKFLSS